MKKKISELPWNEKFQHRKDHQIKHIDKKFSDIPENSDILIATPKIFDDYIRKIPVGTSVDLKKVRQDLAKNYKVDHTCPVTTGLFVRIVAEATYEKIQKLEGKFSLNDAVEIEFAIGRKYAEKKLANDNPQT